MTRIRVVAATLVAAGAMIALAGPASAHVTVSAPGAAPGGSDQIITFRVPTESATASTVALSVQLPTDTPLASVLVAPHPGWTSTVTSTKLATPIQTDDGEITRAVSVISWTASTTAAGIEPGQFDQFVILAGKLPTANSLTFKAIQAYSDGTKVAWIEVAAPGSNVVPDHPAPVLMLSPASLPVGSAVKGPSSSDAGAIALAAIALVVAAAALGFGVVSRAKAGRS